jgi:hypothetical protein
VDYKISKKTYQNARDARSCCKQTQDNERERVELSSFGEGSRRIGCLLMFAIFKGCCG